MAKIKMEKKLSARQILGSAVEIKRAALGLPNDGDQIACYRIIGIARRVRSVVTNFGESFGIRGEFKATRTMPDAPDAAEKLQGAQFASMEVFLPDFATQLILNAISEAKKGLAPGDAPDVEIALDIGLKRNDKLAIGYEYTVTPLQELKASDPLAALEKRSTEHSPLQLAAPAPVMPIPTAENTTRGPVPDTAKKPDTATDTRKKK